MVQCGAWCCSVVQCFVAFCRALQCAVAKAAKRDLRLARSSLQVCCSVVQFCVGVLPCFAACCNVL